MSVEPTTAKMCTVCGIDCAGKPRMKDQQGRYICKECFDKAKQTRNTQKNPPPPPGTASEAPGTVAIPTEGDNSFLLGLGSKESTGIQGTKACPECGRAMTNNAVICIGCGFNISTGKRLPVRVVKSKEKVVKERSSSSGAMSGFFSNGPLLGLIIFLIHAGSGAALFIEPSMGLAMLGVSGIVGLAVWIG